MEFWTARSVNIEYRINLEEINVKGEKELLQVYK